MKSPLEEKSNKNKTKNNFYGCEYIIAKLIRSGFIIFTTIGYCVAVKKIYLFILTKLIRTNFFQMRQNLIFINFSLNQDEDSS